MTKSKYIEMLIQDNETEKEPTKILYADVIDCADIALSQTPETFEIDASIGLKDLYAEIESAGKKSAAHCVGPFEAAELIAKKLGTTYTRKSRTKVIKFADFL